MPAPAPPLLRLAHIELGDGLLSQAGRQVHALLSVRAQTPARLSPETFLTAMLLGGSLKDRKVLVAKEHKTYKINAAFLGSLHCC